jgi:hypothetical protein
MAAGGVKLQRATNCWNLGTLHDGSCAVRRGPAVVTRRQGGMSGNHLSVSSRLWAMPL